MLLEPLRNTRLNPSGLAHSTGPQTKRPRTKLTYRERRDQLDLPSAEWKGSFGSPVPEGLNGPTISGCWVPCICFNEQALLKLMKKVSTPCKNPNLTIPSTGTAQRLLLGLWLIYTVLGTLVIQILACISNYFLRTFLCNIKAYKH